jgi:HEAT repeat protein
MIGMNNGTRLFAVAALAASFSLGAVGKTAQLGLGPQLNPKALPLPLWGRRAEGEGIGNDLAPKTSIHDLVIQSFSAGNLTRSAATTALVTDQSPAGARGASTGSTNQAETLYRSGMRALNNQQWQTAIADFRQLAALHGERGDEALYWEAYADNKQGLAAEALSTIQSLEGTYPGSRWLNDARALELQVRQANGQTVSPNDQPDDQLKLLAINEIMSSDPARAIPLLQRLIEGNQSAVVKERALFVLTQSGSPAARQAVVEIARSSPDPALRRKALDDLALFGGDQSRNLLSEIYASSNDLALKRHILHDFMISGARQQILLVARSDKVPELREIAIYQLGLAGGQAQLGQLYQQETNEGVKKAIVRAMFLGRNQQQLMQVARTDPDPGLRREAIRDLGLIGAQDQLAQLYHEESALDVKKEVLHAMFLGHNSRALGQMARAETNAELRVEAIHCLGLIQDPQTGQALISLYDSNADRATRDAVIDALFIQHNAHALVILARKETDPEMKRHIVSRLSVMHSKEGTDYMLEILSR